MKQIMKKNIFFALIKKSFSTDICAVWSRIYNCFQFLLGMHQFPAHAKIDNTTN